PLTRGLKRGFCGRADSPAKTLLLSLGLQGNGLKGVFFRAGTPARKNTYLLSLGLQGRDFHPTT
ncbi:MAG: hypothetical protein JXA21_25405, partial [Anaerolineae bacterium]|nr:hypothetical protein [Anaerolineae bacterium]